MARQMKDSGIAWIGEIPETWEVTKAKFILSANDGGVWGNDPADDGNDKVVIRSTEQTIDGKWCIEAPAVRDLSTAPHASSRILPGDLLITKSSGSDLHIGKTTLADEYFEANECYFSNFIQRIRCKGYLPRLLWYLFNSNIVREQFVYLQNTTSGIGNINADIIDNLFLPNPPLMMQQRIAAFLDRKCAEIDAVIERTKATIEEYKKLKQAVITEAVTKGVRGERKMKDSGIEWIGEIPEGWSRVKTLYALSMPITDGPHETPELFDSGVPFVSAEAVSCGKGSIDFDHIRGFISEEYYQECCKKYIPQRNDILMIKSGATTGRVSVVDTDVKFTIWSPLAVFRCKADIFSYRYLFYFLQSDGYQKQIENKWTFGTQQNIGMRTLEQLIVCYPPLGEQQEIAAYLDEKCAALDTLIAKKTALLTELETYKKSLIYEYVTGKKEVQ